MDPETGRIRSLLAEDGLSLSYRLFAPVSGAARGSIIHLHGIQSHGAWYVETAAQLARHGFSVYLTDRRGSGSNAGPRGFVRSRKQVLDDLGRFVELAKTDHPGLPAFVMGCCWGAKPALAYALQAQRDLTGLILVCPALRVKVDLSLAQKLKVAAGQLFAPHWQVPIPLTPEMFTTDPVRLQFIREDSLSLRTATARFFFESFLWDRGLTKKPERLTLPALLIQSGSDPIVDHEWVRRWFDGVGSENKRYVLYPDSDHILDFDGRRETYRQDLLAWLDSVAPLKSALGAAS